MNISMGILHNIRFVRKKIERFHVRKMLFREVYNFENLVLFNFA
jgi:hypothetical protein